MPAIFYREAYEAACRQAPPRQIDELTEEHFELFPLLNEALEWLTPQQRCDAIYADWLLSLNAPASGALLQVRDRLIRSGGLAANYLAEFAQNADDAIERTQGGEVRIWTIPGWLMVANNGRRFTAIDLLGLCRFFANGAKQFRTDDLTIGKFGIGFKSCYRIGSEVWVTTWDDREKFGFRIPLCRESIPQSYYDQPTFNRLLATLRLNKPRTAQDELGYCTPEFRNDPPAELAPIFSAVEAEFESNGSIFAIRLHEDGAAALAVRLEDQGKQIYELCPLFLRRLRTTRLEETTLKLVQHDPVIEDAKADGVIAERITLEAQPGVGKKSRARFWRLTQSGAAKPWRIALHADGNFNLNVMRDDEETTSLIDGAAYAFFPLSTVTANWPFRLHLHLDHSTNLDRSNWSPEDPILVKAQISAAIRGLALWLELHRSKWHPDWSLSALVQRRPPRPLPGAFDQQPAWWVFEELLVQVKSRPLLRTITGEFATAAEARSISIRPGKLFREAWREIVNILPPGRARSAWCTRAEGDLWGVTEAKIDEITAFIKAVQEPGIEDKQACRLLTALFGIDVERRTLLDECLKVLRVPVAACTMMELFQRVAPPSPPPARHPSWVFRRVCGRRTRPCRPSWRRRWRRMPP